MNQRLTLLICRRILNENNKISPKERLLCLTPFAICGDNKITLMMAKSHLQKKSAYSQVLFFYRPAMLVSPRVAGEFSDSGHLMSLTKIHLPSSSSMNPPVTRHKLTTHDSY